MNYADIAVRSPQLKTSLCSGLPAISQESTQLKTLSAQQKAGLLVEKSGPGRVGLRLDELLPATFQVDVLAILAMTVGGHFEFHAALAATVVLALVRQA